MSPSIRQRVGGAIRCGSIVLVAACAQGEDIRVRDRGELLYAGRVQVHAPKLQDRSGFGIGGELGGFGTSGDYRSPSGEKDYSAAVGYGVVLFETRIRDFRILPKVGIAYGDFQVDGETRTVGSDGFGGVAGIEGRWAACEWCDVVARGTWFHRGSLDTRMLEAGVELRPVRNVGIDVGYGAIRNRIDSLDLFGSSDEADVETQGLVLGMTLHF